MRLGGRLDIEGAGGQGTIPCEIIGFQGDRALAMPFGSLEGVRRGCPAFVRDEAAGAIRPSGDWLGRVIDALGRPVDGLGPLTQGGQIYPLRADPPPAMPAEGRRAPRSRHPLHQHLPHDVRRAAHGHLRRQRRRQVGAALHARALHGGGRVAVIGLVGERGREVQEFLQDDLGAAGLARSVVVVATSDEPALMRRNAAYVTLSVAEHFRDQGARVLCMIDSITRFAMAQRDIGLAAGEPPTAKGYTPTVFSELPRCSNARAGGRGRHHLGSLYSAGRGRRPQRAGGGCRARHPRRAYRDGALHRGTGRYRRSTCCARSRAPCRAPAIRPTFRWCAGRGGSSRPMRTWRS